MEEDRFSLQRKGDFIIDYAHTIQAYKNIYKDFNRTKNMYTFRLYDRDKSKRK